MNTLDKAQAKLMGADCDSCFCVDGAHYSNCNKFLRTNLSNGEFKIIPINHENQKVIGYLHGKRIISGEYNPWRA